MNYALSIFLAATLRQIVYANWHHYRRLKAANPILFTVIEVAFFLLVIAPIILLILAFLFGGIFGEAFIGWAGLLKRLHL